MSETDAELRARHARVLEAYADAKKAADRTRAGARRGRKMRWAGCLHFTLLQIEDELRGRGLSVDHT